MHVRIAYAQSSTTIGPLFPCLLTKYSTKMAKNKTKGWLLPLKIYNVLGDIFIEAKEK
jgi:hypothetical protein